MRIRIRFSKDMHFSCVESALSPISEAVPDQSLSIKDLFERYTENTLEQLLIREIRQQQAMNDGDKASFGDFTPLNMTYNEMYERSIALSIKYRDKSLRLPKKDGDKVGLPEDSLPTGAKDKVE